MSRPAGSVLLSGGRGGRRGTGYIPSRPPSATGKGPGGAAPAGSAGPCRVPPCRCRCRWDVGAVPVRYRAVPVRSGPVGPPPLGPGRGAARSRRSPNQRGRRGRAGRRWPIAAVPPPGSEPINAPGPAAAAPRSPGDTATAPRPSAPRPARRPAGSGPALPSRCGAARVTDKGAAAALPPPRPSAASPTPSGSAPDSAGAADSAGLP